jgi:hypothetical protein
MAAEKGHVAVVQVLVEAWSATDLQNAVSHTIELSYLA